MMSGDSEGAWSAYCGKYSKLPEGDGTLKLANEYYVFDYYDYYFDESKKNNTTITKDITISSGSFEITFPDSQKKYTFTRQ